MSEYEPRWDRDAEYGSQGEMLWDAFVAMITNKSAEVEVKRDAWWPVTGRLYVETECLRAQGWAPSGIATSRARIWAFIGGSHPLIVAVGTQWLRAAVDKAKTHPANNAKCDRGSHPTRGFYVYWPHIFDTRDKSLDERQSRHRLTNGRTQA